MNGQQVSVPLDASGARSGGLMIDLLGGAGMPAIDAYMCVAFVDLASARCGRAELDVSFYLPRIVFA